MLAKLYKDRGARARCPKCGSQIELTQELVEKGGVFTHSVKVNKAGGEEVETCGFTATFSAPKILKLESVTFSPDWNGTVVEFVDTVKED